MQSYIVCFYDTEDTDIEVFTSEEYKNSSDAAKNWRKATNITAKTRLHAAYLVGLMED
jgi:hypothetical protein